mgnify:CR=1 FL=1
MKSMCKVEDVDKPSIVYLILGSYFLNQSKYVMHKKIAWILFELTIICFNDGIWTQIFAKTFK